MIVVALHTYWCISSNEANHFFCIFLRFLRWAHNDDTTPYKGQCRAEMRRTLCYHCYASVEVNGEVLETECECAAGMGTTAHCKHIQAVLLAIIDFTGGKQPKLELCCTDILQSFHRLRRPHTGSTVKASKLKLTKETLTLNFDPRPQKYRKLCM